MDKRTLSLRLRSLTVFRGLLKDPVVDALLACMECPREDLSGFVSAYSEFVARLYEAGYADLTEYVRSRVEDSENPLIRLRCAGRQEPPQLKTSAAADLDALAEAAAVTPQFLRDGTGYEGPLAGFQSSYGELAAEYARRLERIGQVGFGVYARHPMFRLNGAGRITPVGSPDPVRLGDLVDYQREKELILGNTRALLAGKPAANMLLTGDAGTGKSSTVKAVVNELWQEGLRILEVRKEQLHLLPGVLEELKENPLKFILFIDDLSFQRDDDDFSALKAMLEGSVSAKSRNVAIYATSNRRHLVKETFADREGDEVHRQDAMQEIVSLSERFGLRVTFQRPDKATYLNIVRRLAAEGGAGLPDEELCLLAERFALSRSSRSARAARQFVDGLLAG